MKKLLILVIALTVLLPLLSCDQTDPTTTATTASSSTFTDSFTSSTTTEEEQSVYQLLIEAETLSGMSRWNHQIIDFNGSLDLPTQYRGVTITYSSRLPDIISDEGIVSLPDTCWIESRDQQGTDDDEFAGLNDNWPIVLDVTMSYQNEIRTAKLMFVVAPAEGFTCDKYRG